MNALPLLKRLGLRLAVLVTAAAALLPQAAAAKPRSTITPYLEVDQVIDAELNGGGDVVTYTTVAAGVDAQVHTRRVQVGVSYRYERRIGWEHHLADEDVHSGLAAARIQVVPNVLDLEGGAIAARSRLDPRGDAVTFRSDNKNVAEVYGGYVGPALSTHVGPTTVAASYHLGYVKVDDHSLAGSGYPGGPLDRYDSSTTQDAQVSVGMAPGQLPVGWTVAAGYAREDTDRLKQKFEGKYVRGDVVVPVGPTVAVTGGVGYEKIETSQQDILRDSAGLPVVTPAGRLVADPSKPRLLAYKTDGLIWDAGIIWRPTPRTELQARVGHRYGGTTVTGTLRHQINKDYGLSVLVYDSVSSFGRSLITDISDLPTDFKIRTRGLNRGVTGTGGCIFGSTPGTGGCLGNALQSVAASDFRIRGASALISGSRGPWDMQIGVDYARRKYLTPDDGAFLLHGVSDQSLMLDGMIGRKLTRSSGVDLEAFAEWYDSGIRGNDNVFSTGVTGTYYRSFLLDRLQGQASVGIYTTDTGTTDQVIASALLGLRYQF